jgi:hypothetical protein
MFRDVNDALARKLRIEDAGGTSLPVGALVDDDEVRKANALCEAEGKLMCKARRPRAASATTLLLGITKASLEAKSFLSRASFQTTTNVLIESALGGKSDALLGLKENVLLGRLIPAGTGFGAFSKAKVKRLVEEYTSDKTVASAPPVEAVKQADAPNGEDCDGVTTARCDQPQPSDVSAKRLESLRQVQERLLDAGYQLMSDSSPDRLRVYDAATQLDVSVECLDSLWLYLSKWISFRAGVNDDTRRSFTLSINRSLSNCFIFAEDKLLMLMLVDCEAGLVNRDFMLELRKFCTLWRTLRTDPQASRLLALPDP